MKSEKALRRLETFRAPGCGELKQEKKKGFNDHVGLGFQIEPDFRLNNRQNVFLFELS